MEEAQTNENGLRKEMTKKQKTIFLTVVPALLLLAVGGVWYLRIGASLNSNIPDDVIKLDVNIYVPTVEVEDDKKNNSDNIVENPGRLNFHSMRWMTNRSCAPEFVIGDESFDGKSLVTAAESGNQSCDLKFARVNINYSPTTVAIALKDGKEIERWLSANPDVKAFSETAVFQGVFEEVRQLGRIKSEYLTSGTLKGELGKKVASELLTDGDLYFYYDVTRGKNGFSFSFRRDKASAVASTLNALIPYATKKTFSVRAIEGLVFEVLLGTQRLYVAELASDRRIFVSNSLTGLLNSMNAKPLSFPSQLNGSVVGSVDLNAWLNDNLLNAFLGKDSLKAYFSFEMNEQLASPRQLLIEKTNLFSELVPKLGKGVASAIPHDVFFGFGLSLPVPRAFSAEKFAQQLENSGSIRFPVADSLLSGEGGVALVWDLDGQDGPREWASRVGLIVSAGAEGEASRLSELAYDQDSLEYCKEGNVFLMSRDHGLLTRMLESCRSTSPSILTWKGERFEQSALEKQGFVFLNPRTLLKEALNAGGIHEAAKSFSNDDYEANEKVAQAVLKTFNDSQAAFNLLPVIGFAGDQSGEFFAMSGFTSKQGN